MKQVALIIGYGSIGRRHANILNSNKQFNDIFVLTNQKNIPFKSINSIDQIASINPNYFVIASPTNKHYEQLAYIDESFKNKKILVEKPLYDSFYPFYPKNNKVCVGYCLRFNPVLKLIKSKIKDRKIWNVNIFCGSYLPEWRKEGDYRNSYSANRSKGGGVLLDLSHEIDYINWLFGSVEIDYVYNSKLSNLEIHSDDTLIMNAHSNETQIQLNLNYYSRCKTRQILIDGENISLKANLIKNEALLIDDGAEKKYKFENFNSDDMYFDQHNDIIDNKFANVCKYEEGLNVMKIIQKIRNYN